MKIKFKKIIIIISVIIGIIYVFTQSIIGGIIFLGFVLYIYNSNSLEREIDWLKKHRGKDKSEIPKTMPEKIEFYKGFTIEEWNSYRITDPNGETMEKIFSTATEAKEAINMLSYQYE